MATIGYARVSTEGQDLTAQLSQLQSIGVDKLYQEKASGVKTDRPELTAMLDYVREGDTVIVCKLDRIARSTLHLLKIVETLNNKGVAFKVLNNPALDTSSATGKLMLSILASIGEFERALMLERQAEGIAIAKEQGRYSGRKPTARAKAKDVLEHLALGKTKEAVSKATGISVASIYRIIRASQAGKAGTPAPSP